MDQAFFLIRNIAPESFGGAEFYQIELAKVLADNHFRPIIFTASRELLAMAKLNNICAIKTPYNRCQNWSGWRNILLPCYIIWQVYLYFWYKKQIRKFRPTVINIQSRDEWIAATFAAHRMHIKFFWTDHADFRNWVFQNINIRFKNLIGKFIRRLSRLPDFVVAISDFEAKWIKRESKRYFLNLVVIKNGVVDQKNAYNQIKPRKNSFCYVGRIAEDKGIGELISAFNRLCIQKNDIVLDIYGDGPRLAFYKKNSKNNPRIIFHGYTKDPLRAIASSTIFVLPSYHEGLSVALVQAAMLGKTIIATNIDGNPEVVIDGMTGIMVPPKNDRALMRAMRLAVEDISLAKNISNNARQHYEQTFDFAKTIEQQLLPLIQR